jgi:hypothetical protein
VRIDGFRAISAMVIAVLVLAGGFYALVLYPFVLDDLVKGAIIGFMSTAIAFVFSQEIAKTTATATTNALMQTAPEPPPGAPPAGQADSVRTL